MQERLSLETEDGIALVELNRPDKHNALDLDMFRAIAGAQNPVLMASAMKKAIEAGREAFLAGRIPKKRYASASSPVEGLIA